MKISIGLLLLVGISLANANCPDGFYYDEIRKLCINPNDSSITTKKVIKCEGVGRSSYCAPIS